MGSVRSLDSWLPGFQLSSSFVGNAALLAVLVSSGPLSGVELNVPGDVVPFDGLLEFVAVHRKAAAQEYIFGKWIGKSR